MGQQIFNLKKQHEKGSPSGEGLMSVEADGSVHGRRRRRRRRKGRQAIKVEFGGKTHGEHDGEIERPEVVKSMRCDDAACYSCHHKTDDGCWHGVSPRVGVANMEVVVKANSAFKSFAQEFLLTCKGASGMWKARVREVKNGKIAIYVNDELVKEFMGSRIHDQHDGWTDFKFNLKRGTKARIRAVLVPVNPGLPSSAIAKFKADGMDKGLDACMTVKNCMSTLGDGSDAGYDLRNNNALQYRCLQSSVLGLPSRLASKCRAWKKCLPERNKRIVKVLLKVSGATVARKRRKYAEKVALADKVSTKGNMSLSGNPNGCIDPAVDDPESWECECIQDMMNTCAGISETCFKGIMCESGKVCQHWKDDQCDAGKRGKSGQMIQESTDASSAEFQAAFSKRSQELASSAIDDSLDDSLQGKCSQ